MTGPGPRDLTPLHRQIVAAKGGSFGAVSVTPDKPSAAQRAYHRLLGRPRIGPLAHRLVTRARRRRGNR